MMKWMKLHFSLFFLAYCFLIHSPLLVLNKNKLFWLKLQLRISSESASKTNISRLTINSITLVMKSTLNSSDLCAKRGMRHGVFNCDSCLCCLVYLTSYQLPLQRQCWTLIPPFHVFMLSDNVIFSCFWCVQELIRSLYRGL